MNKKRYSKRQVNMMRVNAFRAEGSVSKNLFIACICGVHELEFDGEDAKNYPVDYYVFKRIIEDMPNMEKLYDQINTYRGAQILKLLGTSVDNKKLSFLTAHKDPLNTMSAKDVMNIVKADLNNYKLLLDIFIRHRQRVAVIELRAKVKKELGMTNEEIKPYKIYITIPDSLKPLVYEYKRREQAKKAAVKPES